MQKQDLGIIIFFAILLIIAFFPIFFQDWVFAHLDTASIFYPYFDFYHDALRRGDSFLWSPWTFSGSPLYLGHAGGFLDPLNRIIFSYLEGIDGVHLRLFINYFLTLFFSYMAGRALKLSRLASSLIGIAYLSSFTINFLANLWVANVFFLTPFLIWIFLRMRSGVTRPWFWKIIAGAGVGFVFLGGYPQMAVYSLFLFGAFVFIYLFAVERLGWLNVLKEWLYFIIPMVAVGLAVALPLILPVFRYISLSVRSEGIDLATALGSGIKIGDFILLFFPNYLYFPYISVGVKSMYVGVFIFFSAIAAVMLIVKTKAGRSVAPENNGARRNIAVAAVFAGVYLVALAIAFEKSPISYFLQQLPVFNLFRYMHKWMFAGTFYLACLGAVGFDLMRDLREEKTMRKMFVFLGAGIGAFSLLVVSLNIFGGAFWKQIGDFLQIVFSKFIYGNFGYDKDPIHYQDAILRGLAAWRAFLSFSDVYFLLPFLGLISSFILTVLFIWKRIGYYLFSRAGYAISLFLFVVIMKASIEIGAMPQSELGSRSALFDKFVPAEERMLYRTFPFLLDRGKFSEVVTSEYRPSIEQLRASAQLKNISGWTNINMLVMPSVDGYDPILPQDLFDTLVALGSTRGGEYGTARFSNSENTQRLLANLDMLGMMAGKYIVSGVRLAHPDLLLRGIREVSAYKIPLYIYENKNALPRFYFAKKVFEFPHGSLTELRQKEKRDFSQITYIDCVKCASGIIAADDAGISEFVLRNGFFEFKTKSKKDAWLVVSESNLPGWQAEIDGVPAEIVRANGLYMALAVPSGFHTVTVRYEGIMGEAKWLRSVGFIPLHF
ncbi:MAG: hypothetical protein HYT98_01275 [Candidatus Sungbacteria bacterium]|nr:hypothetical protein [Candidatus Sungbacteria bacterium]